MEIKFKKIITDVDTRWNSTLFLIRSVSEMRGALDSLKQGRYEDSDKTDPKFKSLIPSDLTFEIIEQIIPIMEKIELLSEVLSGDEKPTLHQVIPLIFNLDSFLYTKMRPGSQNSFQKDYCTAMSKELNRRYPENGTKVDAYCFSHLLHPFFRGALLNNFEGAWTRTQKAFIQQNEVEPEPEVIPVAGEEEEEEFFDAAYRFSQNLKARPSQQ